MTDSRQNGPANQYQHNGWIVSPYSQKTLAYLKYKGIPHFNHVPNGYELMRTIPKHVGKPIMPTVVTPQGEWLQDSAEIIDYFEAQFPQHSIEPTTPKQRIAAHLLELHGDEWLILPALHYRWTEPESRKFIVGEFGKYALPWLPKFIRDMAGNKIRKMMMSYMPRFGIIGETEKGVRRYTENLIALLEDHFKNHKYFLGNRPCVGDFAFFGPIFAHLYRDPGSRKLFIDAPHVIDWMQRLLDTDGSEATPAASANNNFLENDEIPATLTPIFQLIFAEQFPFNVGVIEKINQFVAAKPGAKRVSRIVGEGEFTIGGIRGKRKEFSFLQWKVQRSHDIYSQLSDEQKSDVDNWLDSVNGEAFKNLQIKHPMKRENYREILA
ncbi:glutathione S-transferase family protein [Bacterioplanoides sp.]|uniref:glutathione S-transferase family protein n=1 Tax=Bacterioplanoides sp. TaxID=2066072 RepID=UPI003B591058